MLLHHNVESISFFWTLRGGDMGVRDLADLSYCHVKGEKIYKTYAAFITNDFIFSIVLINIFVFAAKHFSCYLLMVLKF